MFLFVLDKLRSFNRKELGENIRNNWFIALSSLFYLLLNTGMPALIKMPFNSYFSIIPAFVLITVFTAICSPFGMFCKKTSRKVRAVAFFSAAGTCFGVWKVLRYCPYMFFRDHTFIIRTAAMILGIPFVFALCLILWHRLEELLRSVYSEAGVRKYELIFYAVIFLLYCVYVTICFMSSKAFYESDALGDVIYSSDSPDIIKFNAFVLNDHHQNDIRQPLFSIFAAPLMGIPCIIGNLIPGIPMALVLDYAQIALLILTTFMPVLMNIGVFVLPVERRTAAKMIELARNSIGMQTMAK